MWRRRPWLLGRSAAWAASRGFGPRGHPGYVGEGDGLLGMSSLTGSRRGGARSGGASWCSPVWKSFTLKGGRRVTAVGRRFQRRRREAGNLGADQQLLRGLSCAWVPASAKNEHPQSIIPKRNRREPSQAPTAGALYQILLIC